MYSGDNQLMLKSNNCLNDLFDVDGVKNIVKSPTCFKGKVPKMIN